MVSCRPAAAGGRRGSGLAVGRPREARVLEALEKRFREVAPAVDHCSLRFVREREETVQVRQDVDRKSVV